MTSLKEVNHFLLPAWNEKSEEEKKAYNDLLVDDFKHYEELYGKSRVEDYNFSSHSENERNQKIIQEIGSILNNFNFKIIEEIEKHQAIKGREEESCKEIIEAIKNNPNLLNPHCEPGHLTASAIVFHRESRKVLLHKHKKYNTWIQFGGHIDFEVYPHEVALREVREESGLLNVRIVPWILEETHPADYDAHLVGVHKGRVPHYHYDICFLVEALDFEKEELSGEESQEFRWIDVDEALATENLSQSDTSEERIKRLIKKVNDVLEK